MVRFIHAADLHIDRSFEGLSALKEYQAFFLHYNQTMLQTLVDVALEEAVDFLLLAGDTFHQNRPTLKTQRLFFEQMERLAQANIPVYLCFGNHDYYDAARYWFDFPRNIHIFASEDVATITGQTAHERYAISAFSYCQPWITASKVSEFPMRMDVDIHIGMYHGEVGTTGNYAPFQVVDLQTKGYDYWALGHIHVPTLLANQPPICYSGTPLGRTKKEDTVTGVQLVTIAQKQAPVIKAVPIAGIQWVTRQLSLAGCMSKKEALERMLGYQVDVPTCFVQLELLDTEELPKDWLSPIEKQEVLAYLNQVQGQTGQWVYDLILSVPPKNEEQGVLPLDFSEWQLLLQTYQDEHVFQQTIEELWTQPILSQLFQTPTFQKSVLAEVGKRIYQEFDVQEGED
ncbi:metallophosphoesterase family protein [Enterococcus italicus]|uniref:metallophosphoesterase family protein n=1 Tax=Enterococcus italicus TaxID=246144 RepID=UPI00207364F1|nr:DNA repair exonuclease [Enterococcus italicus]